ncbi:hypothetical protein [Acinetobacter sp. ACNIH1]|uniref:hypothetical protein n=1 Tax=Acinetobacter sp. ACNIH1 TaxID=1636603 RepID=UPI000CDC8643|nr:hypothetical protein [Acinetobacter sp. ACNIH1]AUX90084.1 hypothetical protein C3F22_09745 [Acinetobacter sp. ACNIH1]
MTKFKIYLSLLLLNFTSLATATVIHPSSRFLGCEDVKDLAQEVMLFRLKGAPQKWMIQQIKQHYGTANDIHVLIGIKLTEKAFKYEISQDQFERSALIKNFAIDHYNECEKSISDHDQSKQENNGITPPSEREILEH